MKKIFKKQQTFYRYNKSWSQTNLAAIISIKYVTRLNFTVCKPVAVQFNFIDNIKADIEKIGEESVKQWDVKQFF